MQFCALNQKEFDLDGVKIPSLCVSFEDAKAAWVKAGCVIVETRHLPGNEIGVCSILAKLQKNFTRDTEKIE